MGNDKFSTKKYDPYKAAVDEDIALTLKKIDEASDGIVIKDGEVDVNGRVAYINQAKDNKFIVIGNPNGTKESSDAKNDGFKYDRSKSNGVGFAKILKKHVLKIPVKKSDEIFGSFSEKKATTIRVMRIIIEDIFDLTPAEYDSVYCTSVNKKLEVKSLIDEIVGWASPSLKAECFFMPKRILFAEVFPEYYKENFFLKDDKGQPVYGRDGKPVSNITCRDVYYAEGDLKSALTHAAAARYTDMDMDILNKDGTFSNVGTNYANNNFAGDSVDKILYNAMAEFYVKCGYDYGQILEYLINPSNKAMMRDTGGDINKNRLPGIFEIIKKRGCYPTAADFFFLNSPKETQIKYVELYMEMKETYGLKNDPLTSLLYKLYEDHRETMRNQVGLENDDVAMAAGGER